MTKQYGLDNTGLIEATFQRWEMLLQAWNFYLVVSFALMLFVILAPVARTNRKVFWVLLAGFAFFAWTHLLGLLYILKQWAAVASLLRERFIQDGMSTAELETLANAGLIDAPAAFWVVPFHLIADLIVFVGLWIFTRPVAPNEPSPGNS